MKSYLDRLIHVDISNKSPEQIIKEIEDVSPTKKIGDLLVQNIDLVNRKWKINMAEII